MSNVLFTAKEYQRQKKEAKLIKEAEQKQKEIEAAEREKQQQIQNSKNGELAVIFVCFSPSTCCLTVQPGFTPQTLLH